MSVTVDSKTASFVDSGLPSKGLLWSLCTIAFVVGSYFVLNNVPRYFIWSEATYRFYWPRAEFLLPHILGGLVAILIGPFQFWPHIRKNYPKVHRTMGRIYLVSILMGAT